MNEHQPADLDMDYYGHERGDWHEVCNVANEIIRQIGADRSTDERVMADAQWEDEAQI